MSIKGIQVRSGTRTVKKLYRKLTADKLGIMYVYWKDIGEHFDKGVRYVLSDDDYVVHVKNLYYEKAERLPHRWILYTDVGRVGARVKEFIVVDYIKKQQKFKNVQNRFTINSRTIAELIVSGISPLEAVLTVTPNVKQPNGKVYRLFKNKKFMEYIRRRMMEEYQEYLDKAGISIDELFKNILKVARGSTGKSVKLTGDSMLKANMYLLALHGVQPDSKSRKELDEPTRRPVITARVLNELESEKKKLTEATDTKYTTIEEK